MVPCIQTYIARYGRPASAPNGAISLWLSALTNVRGECLLFLDIQLSYWMQDQFFTGKIRVDLCLLHEVLVCDGCVLNSTAWRRSSPWHFGRPNECSVRVKRRRYIRIFFFSRMCGMKRSKCICGIHVQNVDALDIRWALLFCSTLDESRGSTSIIKMRDIWHP